jgi:DNA-directed RNA polymerase specialized sigma24 family protein
MELSIPLETVCRIVLRAREYEAQVPEVDEDEGSNSADDKAVDVLEDEDNSGVEEELRAAIDDLPEDEQAELIALMLVGRGSYDASEWDEALTAAADESPDTLFETPMLAAYIEAGLAAFDLSCDDIGQVV